VSGVFGFVGLEPPGPSSEYLGWMASSLQEREWVEVRTWQHPSTPAVLGQANIGTLAHEVPLSVAADGQIAVAVFGEYALAPSLGVPPSGPMADGSESDAGAVLDLYLRQGPHFPRHLEGASAMAVWDERSRQLLVAGDRLGLVPAYFAHPKGRFLFGPRIRMLLQDPAVDHALDRPALAEFVRFQQYLGDKTLFAGVHLMPYGSVLRYEADTDCLRIERYWDFDNIPAWPSGAAFPEAVEETGRLLRAAVERGIRGPFRLGGYLSGGLDSRTLLALACQTGRKVSSLTYGVPQSRDVHLARRTVRRVGSPTTTCLTRTGAGSGITSTCTCESPKAGRPSSTRTPLTRWSQRASGWMSI
jgi:asparagine synthase (glutamine-hydrolysing)